MFDISDCDGCSLVIMDLTEQIQIDETKNCRIFIGACTSSLFIRNCSDCVFYTCCRQLRLRDCTNCQFYIYSMSEVHIEYSSGLAFAPFNGGYPDHAKHLTQARLDPQHNLWYDIYDHNDPSKTRVNWRLIDPSTYEEPWFPAGVCEPAVPRTTAGSVTRHDEGGDSSMESFNLNQMKAHAAELAAVASPPPAPAANTLPPPLPSPSEPASGPRVAVIGRGEVGITLAQRLVRAGWLVQFGARNPDEVTLSRLPSHPLLLVPLSPLTLLQTRAKSKPNEVLASSPIVTISEAANWSQFILLTVPGMRADSEYTALASQLGDGAEGKLIIDATNPLSFPQLEIFWDGNKSSGELLQAALPKSFVYKAFNTVGLNHLGNPNGSLIPGRDASLGPLKMLFCGGADQREAAAQIISAVGFTPVYVGAIRYSRNLEAIAELWIHLGIPGIGSSENWGMGFHFEPTGV
jgi:predicted dinucleotide-binding enzyme